jgi:hypothetical protein
MMRVKIALRDDITEKYLSPNTDYSNIFFSLGALVKEVVVVIFGISEASYG